MIPLSFPNISKMLGLAKKLAKQVPWVNSLLRKVSDKKTSMRLAVRGPENVFTDYYKNNAWGDNFSRSGPGSSLELTSDLRRQLPEVWQQLSARRILDIPCGDFNWMKHVNLEGFYYVGGDVVEEIIVSNSREHSNERALFLKVNILDQSLPHADLIFCRDCLVHFSFRHIADALDNMKSSGAKWLMMTHFPETDTNAAITTGQWRPLNFERSPFNFPAPHLLLREMSEATLSHIKSKGRSHDQQFLAWVERWSDKSLGVWRISELPELRRKKWKWNRA